MRRLLILIAFLANSLAALAQNNQEEDRSLIRLGD